jgi:endoglucanase
MVVSRRNLLLGTGFVLAAACGPAGRTNTVPRRDVSWACFKQKFLDPSGRIIDNGNGGISHTEGQGLGLTMALLHNDRAAFDTILGWTEKTLARSDVALFSWRFDPRAPVPVTDPNNATDGDIFIAWALSGAAGQWHEPRYATRSAAIRAAIRQRLVLNRYGRSLLLPGLDGFVSPRAVTLNPSYFVWPALEEFRRIDGDGAWQAIIADAEALLSAARFGTYGLPTDWIDVTGHDAVAPAMGHPARFGFDAIRVPLYAMASRKDLLAQPARDFWQNCVANGHPIPAWIDVVTGETAPYAISEGGRAIAGRLLDAPIAAKSASAELSSDYYSAALQILAKELTARDRR